jgi:nucleotide-binding universal stress UspA family protein
MAPTYIAAYDGSDASRSAVQLAVRLAQAQHAEVIAAHVHPAVAPVHGPGALPEADRQMQEDLRIAGQAVLDGLDVDGVSRRMLVGGSPAHALHDLAVEQRASLVAVGVTHHGHLGRLLPGSVGAKLLHGAPCDVVAVPASAAAGDIAAIGVAYDGGPESRRALETAERLASRLRARLLLIGAYDVPIYVGPALATSWDVDPSVREAFDEELRAAAARVSSVEVETRLLMGSPGPTIAEACDDGIDLLVTGSRSYGPVRSVLLGGVSRHLVDHARCPVLVVPRSAGAELDRAPEPEAAQA